MIGIATLAMLDDLVQIATKVFVLPYSFTLGNVRLTQALLASRSIVTPMSPKTMHSRNKLASLCA